ncbi:SMI1/KNR4 family protein [Flavobacterium sp. N502536]|uniref:SMI1/KNR4 family protein n=1 Tax=Flavobacterium sp. N502536 TaxID=2986837 RepID=UPI002222CD82|nr:SMI1/KNR4 family protein [Flavobacterium sp. N502536]
MLQLEELKTKWLKENVSKSILVNDEDILAFQNNNGIVLPNDFILYLKLLNGTGGDCTNDLFEFYGLSKMQNLINEFKDWKGIPDYTIILNKLENTDKIYAFANFSFNLFVYVIKLYPEHTLNNEVFVICGGEYKKIADSFSDFISLYLNDSIELQLDNKDV